MFRGFNENTIDFMWNLRLNNEKSWFEAHRDEYASVLAQPMKELAEDVYSGFSEKHPKSGLALHISRIYRDARHLHGQGPYKDHLWFTLRRAGESWTEKPAFWFELAPENWSYGLGYYSARPLTMAKHRARIDKDPAPLEKLMRSLSRSDELTLEGECYARPKGDPGPLLREWYNMKNFSLIHERPLTEELFSPKLTEKLIGGFEFLLPFYDYFITLDDDPAPIIRRRGT